MNRRALKNSAKTIEPIAPAADPVFTSAAGFVSVATATDAAAIDPVDSGAAPNYIFSVVESFPPSWNATLAEKFSDLIPRIID